MTKTLRKAIMKRSELASKDHKTMNTKDYNNYKKKINFWSKLYKKERSKFYNNLTIQDITDNKNFWKTLNPLLSDKKNCGSSKINMVVDEKSLSDRQLLVKLSPIWMNIYTLIFVNPGNVLTSKLLFLTLLIKADYWQKEVEGCFSYGSF